MRVDPHYVSGLVDALGNTAATQQSLSLELSSGVRLNAASDDPVSAGQAALLGSAISRDDTFVQTATTTHSLMEVADTALGSVVTQLTSALSLAVQGNNGTLSAANRAAIGQQLSGIRDEVLALANTSYQGTYVFSGSQGHTAPFTLDTSTVPAAAAYHGDSVAGSVTAPGGQSIQTGLAGSDVFTSSSGSVLGALNQLVADFGAGAASASAPADTSALHDALSHLSTQRSILDSALSRLDSTSSYVQTDATGRRAAQSALVSADVAAVATGLSASTTQRQALMSVISTLEKGSLFDYTH